MRDLPLFLGFFVVIGALATLTTAAPAKIGGYYDEYRNIPWPEEQFRLDNFAHFLQLKPDYNGYIAIYRGARESKNDAKKRLTKIRNYLVRKRGIEESRLVFIPRDKKYETGWTILQPSSREASPLKFP